MPIPDYQSLMLPLLNMASDEKNHKLQDAYAILAAQFNLSDAERSEVLPSGRQSKFENRAGWARTYLKKAGLLETPARSIFRITKRGLDVLKTNPPSINAAFLKQFPEFVAFQKATHDIDDVKGTEISGETPEEVFELSYKKLRAALAEDLLDNIFPIDNGENMRSLTLGLRSAAALVLLCVLVLELSGSVGNAWARAVDAPASLPIQFFNNGAPDGRMAVASRPANAGLGQIEIEAADDFVITDTIRISNARFTGLLPSSASLGTIQEVEVEIYRVFPFDSANPPSGHVPTRTNSPSDVDFDARSSGSANLTFAASVLAPTFNANNSVINGIHPIPTQTTGGEGPVSGEEVQFDVTLNPPFQLAPNHYFFIPKVGLSSGNFLWLSAAGPSGTDLQAWIRDANLDPDWLRIGTDIVGGGTPPKFNMSFALSGSRLIFLPLIRR